MIHDEQLIITNLPEEKYTDRLNGPTFDLIFRRDEEETKLIITNNLGKYTDRLNGPNFDLTYLGHEEQQKKYEKKIPPQKVFF